MADVLIYPKGSLVLLNGNQIPFQAEQPMRKGQSLNISLLDCES